MESNSEDQVPSLSEEQIEDLVEGFLYDIEDFQGTATLADVQSGEGTMAESKALVPEGMYLGRLHCDNCSTNVYFYFAQSIEIPQDLPHEQCPHCHTVGHIYREVTPKEMMDEYRRRMG